MKVNTECGFTERDEKYVTPFKKGDTVFLPDIDTLTVSKHVYSGFEKAKGELGIHYLNERFGGYCLFEGVNIFKTEQEAWAKILKRLQENAEYLRQELGKAEKKVEKVLKNMGNL